MAVATDSHRDFLIPEYALSIPDNEREPRSDALRLFFFVIIAQVLLNCKGEVIIFALFENI